MAFVMVVLVARMVKMTDIWHGARVARGNGNDSILRMTEIEEVGEDRNMMDSSRISLDSRIWLWMWK